MRARTVVAIPVRDEEKKIGSCLAALARQTVFADHLLLLLNNCMDGTAAAIQRSAQAASHVHVIECSLPSSSANAGIARALAMTHGEALIDSGVILTTDADAEVPENWIEANLETIHNGADAVCGMAEIDPVDALLIPRHLHEDDAREVAYGRLLDEIECLVLPDDADPWPRHTENSGASIALTASMFRRAGGVPFVPSGEDRALIAKLQSIDARVRHDPDIRVLVSGRIDGRAKCGMAETIRRRIIQQDEFADERIEPALVAFHRLRMKWHFKRLRDGLDLGGMNKLARLLGLTTRVLADAMVARHFGSAWGHIEQISPILIRQRVAFRDLSRETAIARRIRRRIEEGMPFQRVPSAFPAVLDISGEVLQ
jgi:Glycosyl transferase family 2